MNIRRTTLLAHKQMFSLPHMVCNSSKDHKNSIYLKLETTHKSSLEETLAIQMYEAAETSRHNRERKRELDLKSKNSNSYQRKWRYHLIGLQIREIP